MAFKGHAYMDESDADDEYERSIISPANAHFDTSSPNGSEADRHNQQHTPTLYGSGMSFKESILGWSTERCAEFVADLGLDQYANGVIEEEIDGEALVLLHHSDLKELGINSVGHRLTILKAVYEIKVKHGVPVEPDHYVPPSADANAPDAHATQDDVARIIKQIQLREERLMACEAELHKFQETLLRFQEEQRKFREEVLPLARIAKDKSAPLPPLDGLDSSGTLTTPPTSADATKSAKDLTRKISKRNFFSNIKMPSPTIHENSNLEASAAAMAASNHLTASMSSSTQSPHLSSQPSPTSPVYNGNTPTPRPLPTNPIDAMAAATNQTQSSSSYRDRDRDRQRTTPTTNTHPALHSSSSQSQSTNHERPDRDRDRDRDRDTKTGGGSGSGSGGASASDMDASNNFMKSFRVSMDEPCHKVLPVALKKYNIADDWRQYSLYIVHGDTERCLQLDEKPLILFKQLANEGKKPMFMLRKHASPGSAAAAPPSRSDQAGGSSNPPGSAGLNSSNSGSTSQQQNASSGTIRQSYASGMQLPGGVL